MACTGAVANQLDNQLVQVIIWSRTFGKWFIFWENASGDSDNFYMSGRNLEQDSERSPNFDLFSRFEETACTF